MSGPFDFAGPASQRLAEDRNLFMRSVLQVEPNVSVDLRAKVVPPLERLLSEHAATKDTSQGVAQWVEPGRAAFPFEIRGRDLPEQELPRLDRESGRVQILVPLRPNAEADTSPLVSIALTVPAHQRAAVRAHVQQIERRLIAWGEEHNLSDTWILESALQTAYRLALGHDIEWHYAPERMLPAVGFDGAPRCEFKVSIPAWNGLAESEEEFRIRAIRECRREVNEYLGRMKAIAEQMGLKTVPPRKKAEHFKWLAEWQVGGRSDKKIAAAYGQTISNFSRRRRERAEEIGLTLRQR